MNTICGYIDTLKCAKEDLTSEKLYEIVKTNDKLLRDLCECCFNSYDSLKKIQEILKGE